MECNNSKLRVRKFMREAERKFKLDEICLKIRNFYDESDLAEVNQERLSAGRPPYDSIDDLVLEFRDWAQRRYRRVIH